MLYQLLKPALIIYCLAIPAWIIFRITASRKKEDLHYQPSLKKEVLYLLFYIYLICILIITIVPIPLTERADTNNRINILPLANIYKEYLVTRAPENRYLMKHLLENVIGNILLFFPLGAMLPLVSNKNYSLKKVILTAIIFSFFIELIQLVSKLFGVYRSVDIDDIILNTLGAMLGFIIVGKQIKKNNSLNKN